MTQLTALAKIKILPDRQRRDIDEETLAELARSLKTAGLLHPPVVRELNGELVLVAGERRIRALQLAAKLGWRVTYAGQPIPEGMTPFNHIGELDAIAAEEAELEENVKRKDLSWQERAHAESRLHNLRQAQAKLKGAVQTVGQTAAEIHGRSDGYYQGSVRTNLILAQHLEDPDVAKATSARDALKVLQRKEEVRRNTQRAAELGQVSATELHRCLQGDFRNSAACPVAPASIDVILTDPPYGIDAGDFGDSGGKIVAGSEAHRYDDSYESWKRLMLDFASWSDLVAKPQAALYAFCDIDRFMELRHLLGAAGWQVHRTPLVWHKQGNGGRVPWPESGHRRQYEIILYAIRGKRSVNFLGGDVISVPNDDNLGHGAQKPVGLYLELLRRSARAGDKVLDPFCGTGPIFPAAHELKCLATGIELDPAHYAIAANRLGALK